MVGSRFVAVAAGLLVAAAGHAASPDLVAVVSHESTVVTSSGVTRIERFEERVVRSAGHVWTERVLPARRDAHDHAAPQAAAAHRHFDFESAVRHVSRDADGRVRLEYVDRERKWTVFVPAAEYGPVGFSGSWDAEWSLVPAGLVARMPVRTVAGAASRDAVAHEDRRDGWTHRVVWSVARDYPLMVEAVRDDGMLVRRSKVRFETPKAGDAAPWSQLSGYTAKTYDDFMD